MDRKAPAATENAKLRRKREQVKENGSVRDTKLRLEKIYRKRRETEKKKNVVKTIFYITVPINEVKVK